MPKHVTLTCGATGAIHAALYALKDRWEEYVVVGKRYFPFYPNIIGMSGMAMINRDEHKRLLGPIFTDKNFLTLTDSPNNPDGLVYPFENVDIWDGAYAGQQYTDRACVPQGYRIFCGSLAKTLGLGGIRLGWAATDDDALAHSLDNHAIYSYCGLPWPSID